VSERRSHPLGQLRIAIELCRHLRLVHERREGHETPPRTTPDYSERGSSSLARSLASSMVVESARSTGDEASKAIGRHRAQPPLTRNS
jgi:hypothetical protein